MNPFQNKNGQNLVAGGPDGNSIKLPLGNDSLSDLVGKAGTLLGTANSQIYNIVNSVPDPDTNGVGPTADQIAIAEEFQVLSTALEALALAFEAAGC